MQRELAGKAVEAGRKPGSDWLVRRKSSVAPPQHPVLALRQIAGNQAFGRWLQTKRRDCGCDDCRDGWSLGVQGEALRVNEPDDVYEKEADRIADHIMTAPESRSRQSALPGPAIVQRNVQSTAASLPAAPAVVDDGLSSSGQSLDGASRAFFEPRFNRDFGGVRIHADAAAARSAHALNARAYTVGQQIVFGQGQYSPQSDEGKRLLAHELAHVLQQSGQPQRLVQRELIYGSGYSNPYSNDPAETRDAEIGAWFPSTDDMSAAAKNSGGGTGASKFAGLLQTLKGKAVGSITELGLIGHANSTEFALGGTIKPGNNVFFAADATIDSTSLAAKATDIAAVKNRFAADAKIVLYGCHSGVDAKFLDALSLAFGVCVEGFSNEITYCIIWNDKTRHITSRGRVYVININDPLQARPDCQQFYTSVKSLTPDLKSCKGAPAKPAPSPKSAPSLEL